MKLSHLRQIVDYLQQFHKIDAIHRTADNTIKIAFDRDSDIYFDMRRGNSHIFISDNVRRSKVYQAPFDVVLAKSFNRARILDISLLNDDKIIRIKAAQSSAYRETTAILQLEFTGKHTNAIILDEEETVLEALRHIDAFSSYRIVKVGQRLEPLEPPTYTPKAYPIDDVEAFLRDAYARERDKRLSQLKQQKHTLLQKRLDKLQDALDGLDDETTLNDEVAACQMYGNLILANMHLVKPYMRSVELYDFDGNLQQIDLPEGAPSASAVSEHFFKKAKKAKQRLKNLHIERQNLSEKITHLRHFQQIVRDADDVSAIEMLFPPQVKGSRKKENLSIETFWIEGYKVMLGKNERGNVELLERARARDIWLHLKERPSTHVIIVTDKQNVPRSVIEAAARLCVDFTLFEKGRYLVDYTPRREVKIQEGANVLYNKYQTIQVDKS
jgi:predicted ribosome quality control (RQC) complex YloA/Tae2 family protein